MQEFKNPYADLPKEEVLRSTLIVPYKLKSRYTKYDPKDGVLQTTISILLTKLADELERTTEPGDRYGFQAAVANCSVTIGAKPTEPATPTTPPERSTVVKPSTRRKPAKSKQAAG